MGTHGRRGFNRFLLGSEAERVLRFAPCPVLTVSKHADTADLVRNLGRILVPIDFSRSSDRALEYGVWLAERHDSVLDVVHVFDEPVVPPFLMDHTGSYVATDPKMKDRCLESMDRHLAPYRDRGIRTEKHVLEGRIASTLHEFAEKQDSNLIVMGTRGLSGLDYLLLGSTAAHMVRLAPCPVLTVHAEEAESAD
jgi:nucleotide-binding universal stress UspA family protein